jgi:hypothetical protein
MIPLDVDFEELLTESRSDSLSVSEVVSWL